MATAPYRPSLLTRAANLVETEDRLLANPPIPLLKTLRLPDCWSISRPEKQLSASIDDAASLRFRRVCGFIGEIKILQTGDSTIVRCETPAHLKIIAKLWWMYGNSPAERHDSFIYCRVQDFTSAACCDGPHALMRVGDPVTGFIEATIGGHGTAQLTGRGPVSSAEWKLRHPRSFMAEGIEVSGDAIAVLHQLPKANFLHRHFPNDPYARMSGPLVPKYLDPYGGSFSEPAAKRIAAGK